MQRSFLMVSMFVLSLTMFHSTSIAGPLGGFGSSAMGGRGMGGDGPGSGGMKAYDKNSVLQVEGRVSGSEMSYNRHMGENGLHVTLESSKGSFIIHVCPQWYAEQQKISFKNGETITVVGSEFEKHGEQNIYAATIRRQDASLPSNLKTLLLRNPDSGAHLWSGRYRSQKQEEMRQKMQNNRAERPSPKGFANAKKGVPSENAAASVGGAKKQLPPQAQEQIRRKLENPNLPPMVRKMLEKRLAGE
ncbi:MAG: hypothetical protein HQL69_18290 [Magnetococcales bacterium]|nr:hypothetical protein [Magnetococcales bacterium]